MKKTLLLIVLLITSCGSNNELETSPVPSNPFVQELIEFDETVDVGNYVVFEEPSFLKTSSGKKCVYKVTTRVDIVNVVPNEDHIQLRVRKAERPHRRNANQCPRSYGVSADVEKTYKYSSVHKAYSDRARQALDAEFFCTQNTWCKRAELISKKDTYFDGVKAYHTVLRIAHNNGQILKRVSWIAQDNIFLNTLAFQLREWRSDRILDYKKTKDFSYKAQQ